MSDEPLGFVLGKFLPPHRGHEYLIRFARRWMRRGDVVVLVCSLESEAIPGDIRFRWMCELLPGIDIRHCSEDLPQEPTDHPAFWEIWKEVIIRHCGRPPTHVFASEGYGRQLADVLGATFIPVDIARQLVPVSGTDVRTDVQRYWDEIPDVVRPWFTKRIAILGPESAGKTTLSRELAEHYTATWIHEWARPFYDWKGPDVQPADMVLIARGQDAAIHARERQGRRILITDTDTATTSVWSEILFGSVDREVEIIAAEQRIDFTIVLESDVPWTDDGQRMMPEPERRLDFVARLCSRLDGLGRRYVRVNGEWAVRRPAAIAAIDAYLAEI